MYTNKRTFRGRMTGLGIAALAAVLCFAAAPTSTAQPSVVDDVIAPTVVASLEENDFPVLKQAGPPQIRPRANTFVAPASGDQEVPPADTRARGNTTFQLSKDGAELSYQLTVANLHNITMAHIHRGAEGVNGSAVVWLYPAGPPLQLIEGRTSGVLAKGVITADDLVGPLAGATLEDLVDLMRKGEAYVNVHTSQYPAGEIRGQIRPAGRR